MTTKTNPAAIALFAISAGAVIAFIRFGLEMQPAKMANLRPTKTFSPSQLSTYDGSSNDRQIYLALDGNVYDVSGGRQYYKVGGTYHFLAGRDSSTELHFAGAGIIRKKYPIVGRLTSN